MNAKQRPPKPRKRVVVAEVGNDGFKLARVDAAGGALTVAKLYLSHTGDGDGDPAGDVVEAVRGMGLGATSVIACLPRGAVNIRVLDLPSTDPAEIADMVELQVGKQTPYSRDEILADYRVVGGGRRGYSRVMLAIVQRAVLRQKYALLEDSGLDVERMTISSEALLNAELHLPGGGGASAPTAVLVDVDAHYCDFLVFARGALMFTRSILIGADHLLDAFEDWKEKFARELQRSIETCRNEMPGFDPKKVTLGGAAAAIEGLAAYLNTMLGMEVEIRDSLAGVNLPAEPDVRGPEYRSVSLSPLLGLAAAPDQLAFNLVPDGVKMRKALLQKSRRLAGFATLTVMALVSASLFATTKFFLARQRLHELRLQAQGAESEVQRIVRMQHAISVLRERRDPSRNVLGILSDLHRTVNGDVFLEVVEFDAEAGKILLGGSAGVLPDVRRLKQQLEETGRFESLREDRGTALDPGSNRYKFEIVCTLKDVK